MQRTILMISVRGKMLIDLIKEEHGQDLVEYAAVISLLVLGLTAGMNTLADGINDAMTAVSTKITTKLS
jgi:Flp pilus assembly pilin Flp